MFIVAFNLSGLPYSAGFIGKEFLLFQVFRDDLISLYIRACWLVSFFFTPIYMFMLTFVVQFGLKKGFHGVYSSGWGFNVLGNISSLFYFNWNNVNSKFNPIKSYNNNSNKLFSFLNLPTRLGSGAGLDNHNSFLIHTIQHTNVTSRLTSYVLFFFWLFFMFWGENLILIITNYSTLSDMIPSSSFNTLKQHVIYFLRLSNPNIHMYLTFYIYILVTSSFLFMVNFNYKNNFNSFSTLTISMILPLTTIFISLL